MSEHSLHTTYAGSYLSASGTRVFVPKGEAGNVARGSASQLAAMLRSLSMSAGIDGDVKALLVQASVTADGLFEMIDIVEDDTMLLACSTE